MCCLFQIFGNEINTFRIRRARCLRGDNLPFRINQNKAGDAGDTIKVGKVRTKILRPFRLVGFQLCTPVFFFRSTEMLIGTMRLSPLKCWASFSMYGISSQHGPHQVAQMSR